jgi:uncharacterized membrane protein YjgN (DUF898 family)
MNEDQDSFVVEACEAEELAPAANDSATQPETLAFTFTGSGQEYFRIWVVNLMLTVATLGIYSAWAKVRRLQYFDRNTQLAGATFDFRGDPKAILKGRMLAVCLFAAYHYAIGFSQTVGLVVIGVLLAALPCFVRSALRFRLHNTQYRGVHFDFSGSVGGAYRAYLPPLVTFLLPGVAAAVVVTEDASLYALLLYLAWPLMFGAMKSYQQRHLQFGTAAAAYDLPVRRFIKPFLIAVLVALAGMTVLGTALGLTTFLWTKVAGGVAQSGWERIIMPLLGALMAAYTVYLLAGPYLQARFANMVWSNTAFPGVELRSTMRAREFVRLQTVNALLTVLTLGLFRPFAAVRVYRYRLAHLEVHTSASFEQHVAAARRRASAAGDGVADFGMIDLSW